MAQTLVPNGIPVNFGFVQTADDYGITDANNPNTAAPILSGFLLQSADYETGADVESVRSLQGDISSRNWYDLHKKATLRLFVAATAGRASARAATTLAGFTPGTIIAITACASHPDLVQTHWECQQGAKIMGDVVKSAEISVPMELRPLITSSQAA